MMDMRGWRHINTAPKDREILVWDGEYRHVSQWNGESWITGESQHVTPQRWRGCPPPPEEVEEE